jgi:glutathione S-transferase
VPVLCLSEFEVIEESLEIMRWALVQSDPNDWLRGTHQQTAQDLLQRNDGPFKQALDRYKYGSRFPAINPTDSRGQALEALIEPLAAALAHQPFIGGQSPILHDVAVFPFVRQFAAVQPDWFDENAPQPVRRWLSHWLDSELFASIMQKLPPER